MSLKDEIEKIIHAERKNLESRDQKDREFNERQRDRFQPLRTLLNELIASIDPTYLEAWIGDSDARIDVGSRKGDWEHLETDEGWNIEPNHTMNTRGDKNESLFNDAPGFNVPKTVYSR